MARNSTADVVEEEQAQLEEALRRRAKEEEALEDQEDEEPGQHPPEDETRFAVDDVHIEKADRLVHTPLSEQDRAEYLEQLTDSMIRVKELQDEKRARAKEFSDRITSRQQEAMAAAKALKDGGTHAMMPCECIWDYQARTYTERTVETGQVIMERALTQEEIERFQQMYLPGFEGSRQSWLTVNGSPRQDEIDNTDGQDLDLDADSEDLGDEIDDEDEGDVF